MPQQLNPVVLSLEMHIALEIPFHRYQWFGSKLSSYSVACTSGEFLKKFFGSSSADVKNFYKKLKRVFYPRPIYIYDTGIFRQMHAFKVALPGFGASVSRTEAPRTKMPKRSRRWETETGDLGVSSVSQLGPRQPRPKTILLRYKRDRTPISHIFKAVRNMQPDIHVDWSL